MLARENILHQVENGRIYAYGNRSDEFAKFLDGDTRRPMLGGMLNPAEPKNVQMIELLLNRLCGRAGEGEKICLSVPSAPRDRDTDLIFHEQSVQSICEKLGYQAQVVNEGLAVVYSELKDANFTGIGMSFGGGMCNICLSYLGLPVLTVATDRAGDYIDQSTASVTGETPTTVRLHKENSAESGFTLDNTAERSIDRALSVYYADVIDTAASALQAAMSDTKKLPRFNAAVPIVCAGGTTMAGNFLPRLKSAIDAIDLPIEIGDVFLAKDPMNATAKGALVGAMLNMSGGRFSDAIHVACGSGKDVDAGTWSRHDEMRGGPGHDERHVRRYPARLAMTYSILARDPATGRPGRRRRLAVLCRGRYLQPCGGRDRCPVYPGAGQSDVRRAGDATPAGR
jgi:hypothetical protein